MSFIGKFTFSKLPAKMAKPSQQIGAVFGRLGLNMAEFCKQFNARTEAVRPGVPLRVKLYAYSDRTYVFNIHPPESMWFIRRTARVIVGKSACKPLRRPVGYLTNKEVYYIAKAVSIAPDNMFLPLRSICYSIIETARAAGIDVTDSLNSVHMEKREQFKPCELDKAREAHRQQNKLRRRK